MADRIQFRRDTAANWTSADPTLAQGEIGFETDTNKLKVGDGSSTWSSIAYYSLGTLGYVADSDIGVTVQAYDADTAKLDVAQTFTAAQKFTEIQESYNAFTSTTNASTIDCSTGTVFSHTLTENTTVTFSNPPATGTAYGMTVKIVQDAGASGYTVTWPTSVDWPAATAPTLTATASAVDVFVFITHDAGTTWYGFTAGQALA